MDFLKELINTFFVPIVGSLLAYIVAKLVSILMTFIKVKIRHIHNIALRQFLWAVAMEAVLYVEQKYKKLKGTEKFEKAVEIVESKIDDFTERMGLGREVVSDKDIEVAIEAAVKAMNESWGKKK